MTSPRKGRWSSHGGSPAGKDGDAIFEDMTRGAEAYLQTWERAEGIKPDSCRNAVLRKSVATVGKLIRRGHDDRGRDAQATQGLTRGRLS